MVARAGRGYPRTNLVVSPVSPWRVSFLMAVSSGLALAAGVLTIRCFASAGSGGAGEAVTITMLGLAGLVGITAMALGRANNVLATRLDLLVQLLDAAPDARLIVAPDGRVGYANAAFDHLFSGRAASDADCIEHGLCDDPGSQARLRGLRLRAAAGDHTVATFLLPASPSGSATRFDISAAPIGGHPGYSRWTIQDVAARESVVAALQEERNTLANLLDNAPIGLCCVDSDGRFRSVNRTLADWLGDTPSELTAGAVRLHDFLVSLPDAVTSVFAGGAEADVESVELRTRQGWIVPGWIKHRVAGPDADLHVLWAARHLTPEPEWRVDLKSVERFRRCFANAPVGIALIDRRGHFEEANRALADLFGTTPEHLKGQELTSLLSEEDRDRVTARLAAAAKGHTDPEPTEIRPEGAGDKTVVLFLGCLDEAAGTMSPPTPAAEAEGQDGLILYCIDVTEQKSLETQFAQSQKMQAIGQLAGGVAHDFNNLLTAMIGFCDLLLLRSPPNDPAFADIMQIKQNANRAANLVRQLLAFSRQQTLQPRILSVTDVLYELRHLIERLIGENIKLDVVHGRDLGFAKVDQGQLEQVIINLAVNARDAMPDGGTLTIRTANVRRERDVRRGHEIMLAGEYVVIEIIDTGVGIPKENLDRIFDPFFSTKELGSGTGLGLSTVYGIIKQTGGFVFVSSRPGEGAAFEIYLPRCDPADPAPPARLDSGEPLATTDLTGHGTIMLVEDDDPVRIFGARALRNKGYRVIEAKSGEAALARIRNGAEKIDLLITDVVMPYMDGPSLAREVRALHPEMKVIFISGYTEDAFRRHLDSGAGIDFLPKPFSLKQLAAKVRDVLAFEPG
jgi:two-component system cell cycle sensor histidine kinase/response regulator CckA